MRNEIGIGILDLYTQEDLEKCYESIPKEYNFAKDLLTRIYVASNNNNKPVRTQTIPYSTPIQIAAMRNHLISQMRLRDLKYYFILHSNQTIKDPNIFEKTIQLAETFGTWAIFGPSTDNIPLEDDEKGITLNISKKLNSEFMFLYSGIIKNNGYFDERYFNGKELDVIDYIIKMREKGVYPPTGFHPTINSEWLEKSNSEINKKGFADMPSKEKDVQISYAFFFNQHKYIPNETDPQAASNEELLKVMESLQTNYAKK